jgi:3-hydroxyisobutyrate dehydrogenase-like beta-hydroxyacid dehydrogenase
VATVGLLHPGEMGAAIGAALVSKGTRVLWASAGRSEASAARASQAGLVDAGTVGELVGACDVVLSVCPPHAALGVAVAAAEGGGVFVDANAVSPATAAQVAGVVGRFVDGGIVGPPPAHEGSTRLFLAGADAEAVAALFAGTVVEARVLAAGGPYAASALKMAYAAWTKGSAALLLATRSAARALGMEDELVAEWARSQPGLEERWQAAGRAARTKGWRWTAEMEEVADTLRSAGQPEGFHRAAAEVYRRGSPG